MAFIATIPAADAKGEVLEMYQQLQGSKDYLPNYAKVFCHRPGVMSAWAVLQEEIKRHLPYRHYELIILAVAQVTGNSYCALTHGSILARKFYDDESVLAMTRQFKTSALTQAEKAMVSLAQKVAIDASSVNESDIQELKSLGFSDEEIFDIVTAAAARCFFPKIPDALGVQPDPVFWELDSALRSALTVGREISRDEPESACSG